MADTPDTRRNIPPNPPRWQPNPDPASIHVPGLDTSAPVLDQIEQMEQLITLKLQNIDENFSKIHHVLANKVLPALKRYAVATEPVREAAKFWTSFYEQAAQIHIPTFDDHSTVNEESRQPELTVETIQDQREFSTDSSQSHHYEPSMASTNGSFIPGHAAFSSTPATMRMINMDGALTADTHEDSTWAASLDTPLIRTHQDSGMSAVEDESILGPSTSNQKSSLLLDEPTPNPRRKDIDTLPRSEKGKAKSNNEPLLRNVLRHTLYPVDTSQAGTSSGIISPLKYRGKPKTPVPKKHNPFLLSNKDPADWDGVVDLRDPSITTPQRNRRGKPSSRRGPTTPAHVSDDEESFDGLPPGMSPPVLMSPARPPRSSAELGLKLGQTPTREASARITRDLVRDIQYKSGNATGYLHSRVESTMSTMPTPPSFSRYHRHGMDTTDSIVIDSSLESMIRRVGLNVPSSVATSSTGTASTPGLRLRSQASLKAAEPPLDSLPTPQLHPIAADEPITPVHPHAQMDMDSDSDSMDEINNTAHPSAAFLMASSAHGRQDSDDSFGSSNHSSDSLNDDDGNLGLDPVNPFVGSVVDDGFDDSYDDDVYNELDGEVPEETLFGVPPSQRAQAHQRAHPSGNYLGDELRMLGDDLLQDTIGIGARIGRAEETPTPAAWGNRN
ncbi:hypothetical protein D9615_001066 [Tricholomella constricta]|uniref:DASH complex subunit ASK1 n=1 Tax=Tricholomella constricta TaxID=117010 RepID=A0A8H5M917_9AGAR|nr:hypothetical protein D9615_001066 [Tricholomella constricta]